MHGSRNHPWVVAWSCQGPYLVSNVINEEGSVGIPVIEVTDTLVLLLACCVPDLKLDSGFIQVEYLCEEGACRQDAGCVFTWSKSRELRTPALRPNPSQRSVMMF